MDDIVIRIDKLSKVYRLYNKPIDRLKESLSLSKKIYHKDHYALNNITLDIKKGETIGIIGTNGSGKSTLLKIITGILTPTKGSINVKGKISALLELGAGFNPEFTGIENIYLNGTMQGYTNEEISMKIDSILEFADIGNFVYQPVKTYSSGMFARLAFAVAVTIEPEILIVDEALAVGDTRFQLKCMNKMKDMMKGGTTVLFVSHDTNSIRRFCTRAIWLNNGVIQDQGDVNNITDKYLDFLKCKDINDVIDYKTSIEMKDLDIKEFKPNSNIIAEIVKFDVLDKFGKSKDTIYYDEAIEMKVVYDVYDESLKNPVVGIAVRSIDNDYICGVNTLLDNLCVSWKYGRNIISLEYNLGIRALGGKYYFDVALFDETATVPIQYISRIKDITVISNYVGEGRYIIPHKWIV